MKIFSLLVFSVLYFATNGIVLASEISIETARGKVSISKVPEKVIVMDVSAIDTMNALGIKPVGVPKNLNVDYLEDVQNNTRSIGTLFEPDYEAIYSLQPDLIIVGGRSAGRYDDLKKIAPTIDMTIWGEDIIEQAKQRLVAYGKLFAKQQQAKQLEEQFEQKIAEAKNVVKGKGNALIILTNGPKISAYGIKGRFGWLHKALEVEQAVTNIADASHGEAISFEFIRNANPDWLFVIDRLSAIGQKGAAAKRTLDNELIRSTKAWQSNKVIYLNAANIYIAGGGIQSISNIMDEIISAYAAKD